MSSSTVEKLVFTVVMAAMLGLLWFLTNFEDRRRGEPKSENEYQTVDLILTSLHHPGDWEIDISLPHSDYSGTLVHKHVEGFLLRVFSSGRPEITYEGVNIVVCPKNHEKIDEATDRTWGAVYQKLIEKKTRASEDGEKTLTNQLRVLYRGE